MNKSKISVLIPVYKGSAVLNNALQSIFNQTYRDFEVIVADDTPPKFTTEIEKIKNICLKYKTIKYIKNKKNLGCQKNFQTLLDASNAKIVIFLAQDDVFSKDALEKVVNAFTKFKDAAFITRPYFWFESDISKPVRYVPPINRYNDIEITIKDDNNKIKYLLCSLGQISGLAFRRKLITQPFHQDIFTGHIYVVLDLLKRHSGIFLKDYIVAVSIFNSQSRNISSIYDDSPTIQWLRMFETIFNDPKFRRIKKFCKKHLLTNFEGLIQLKNFANKGVLEKEIFILLRYRLKNIFNIKYLIFSTVSLITPRKFLIKITDWYKRKILSQQVPKIIFNK